MECMEDLELTCELCEITTVERVLPLRLKGVARETYRQLSKEQRDDVKEIKRGLTKAYGTDSFVAFEQFTTRCLHPEETADEVLTDLQRLTRLVGEIPPECWIKCAFVNGLSSHVRGLPRSSTRLETLTLREVLERARTVLVDTRDEHLAAVARPEQTSHTPNIYKSDVTCFRCRNPNHLARDCMPRSSVRNRRERSAIRCHLCNKTGHPMKNCPENGKRGRDVSVTLSPFKLKEVLPVIEAVVNGKRRMELVNSGCSRSLVTKSVCNPWSRQASDVLTVDDKTLRGNGIRTIMLAVDDVSPVKADVLVVNSSLWGFDMLIGMDVIRMLGGVHIDQSGDAIFSWTEPHVCAVIRIEEPDFNAEFNEQTRAWTELWKWSSNQPPNRLVKKMPESPMSAQVRQEYRHELETWLNNGWLLSYPEEELGPPKALIPFMAVYQQNKSKVCPVLDFRELNGFVDAYTAHADVCAQKLREWRKKDSNVSVLDLRRAYLQVREYKSLWSYQTVILEGKRYCLSRMDFGLNVAPSIMRAIVEATLSKDNEVRLATSAYIDDVFINKDIVSATRVRQHLANFGLASKEPERLQNGARVLSLTVREVGKMLTWERGNEVPSVPQVLTRRSVFSFCGKLVGHFPVVKWLRVAAAF